MSGQTIMDTLTNLIYSKYSLWRCFLKLSQEVLSFFFKNKFKWLLYGILLADMRIVASTTSMLEEPYWRNLEPNPLIAKKSQARKQQKGLPIRLHYLISLIEAAH